MELTQINKITLLLCSYFVFDSVMAYPYGVSSSIIYFQYIQSQTRTTYPGVVINIDDLSWYSVAQWAGDAEYTDYTSAEG